MVPPSMTDTAPPDAPTEAQPDDYEEFARLKPSSRPRSPVLAVTVVALAAIVIFHLRADLRYALSSRTPIDLGDASTALARASALVDNSYVRIKGVPDRANGLRIEPRGEKYRLGFYRLYGTASRIYVRVPEGAVAGTPADEWEGRLQRFDALPFGPSLREHHAKTAAARRHFDPAAVRAALEKPGAPLVDRAGDPATATGNLSVDVRVPDEILFYAPRDKYPAAKDAEYEITRQGIPCSPLREEKAHYVMVAKAPLASRDKILAQLDTLGFEYEERVVRHDAPMTALHAAGGQLEIADAPAPVRVDWSNVVDVALAAPIAIADDAWVILEGETPAGFTWVPVIAVLLLAFAAFNIWYLVRRRTA
jgi:hypothetical protein